MFGENASSDGCASMSVCHPKYTLRILLVGIAHIGHLHCLHAIVSVESVFDNDKRNK